MKRKTAHKCLGIAILLALSIAFVTGCGSEAGAPSFVSQPRYNSTDTWAIYWYLCGTDLETNYGAATEDLFEMMQVKLPENIQVIIETGGTESWHNDFIDPDYNSRWLYDSDGLHHLEDNYLADMGDAGTLVDFLEFCDENFPADHRVFIFWDHGAGSVDGMNHDELFDNSLSLADISWAFNTVFGNNPNNPPFELIGFDACLMATIHTAGSLYGLSRWMVASQELEPGCGWLYSGWLQALANDPGMNGAMLGKAIADTFYIGCEDIGQEDDVTLSVIDLSMMPLLLSAYYDFGAESLFSAVSDPSFFSDFGRSARNAENYGGNTRSTGFTNMVDLGDIIRQGGENLLPATGEYFLELINQAVVYKIAGPLRQRGSGLSGYFNFNGDRRNLAKFAEIRGDEDPYRWFSEYMVTGNLSWRGEQFLEELIEFYQAQEWEEEQVPKRGSKARNIESAQADLEDYPVIITEDGNALLDLGFELADNLVAVYCIVGYYDEEEDLNILLGRDNDIYTDWENGRFTDNFRGVWGSIDGEFVYMDIVDSTEEYNIYEIPVKLNGEEFSLRVSYTYETETYRILGARRGIGENGIPDKNLRQLRPGDILEPLLYVMLSGEEDFTEVSISSITVTDSTSFEDIETGDGIFSFMFEMVDIQNNSFYSDIAVFTVQDGGIFAMIVED